MNKKIIKLDNNKEYFLVDELIEENTNYLLLINIDNESDIIIAKKSIENNEEYIIEINDNNELSTLKSKFKQKVDNDKKIYS